MNFVKSVALFLIIPFLAWMVASWSIGNTDSQLMKEFGVTSGQLCTAASGELGAVCDDLLFDVNLLKQGAVYTAIAAVSVLLSFSLMSLLCGKNRAAISRIFPIMVPLILISLASIVIVQGAMATYSLYLAQVIGMGRWYPVVTVAIGIGALVAASAVIKALVLSFRTREHVILNGLVVDEQMSPELHGLVDDVAEKISARPPDNVVVGLDPTFYAVSAPVRVLSADRKLTGETLYLSLPLMRILNIVELRSVIGHELGHFTGKDTEYSKKFSPVFGSLHYSYTGLSNNEQLAAIPVKVALGTLLSTFDRNVKAIGRDREIVADTHGATAGSADALITALLKVSIYGDAWAHVTSCILGRMEAGLGFSKNISWLFASVVKHNINRETLDSRVVNIKNDSISHPMDSHPPTSERARQLNVSIDSMPTSDFLVPEESSLDAIPGHKEMEEVLSHFQQVIYEARGASGEMDDSHISQRIVSMFAAYMVLADGRVERTEIEVAKAIGEHCFENFDYFQFREYCHYPELLPDMDKLLEYSKGFSNEFKALLYRLCTDISGADGEVSVEEEELLTRLRATFGTEDIAS